MTATPTHKQGFTLIELIVFIIVASIVFTLISTYSMSSRHSVEPVSILRTRLQLQKSMELLVVGYKQRLAAGSFQPAEFKAFADTSGMEGVAVTTAMVIIQSDDRHMLQVTLSKEGQSVCALFPD
ncbi:MAG: prepilin-type N-terminal cleavage/methylation domain-containing protein [Pseudomonadota bacterium]